MVVDLTDCFIGIMRDFWPHTMHNHVMYRIMHTATWLCGPLTKDLDSSIRDMIHCLLNHMTTGHSPYNSLLHLASTYSQTMSGRRASTKTFGSHEQLEYDDREATYVIDPIAEKRLVRKLDMRLIPWLSLLYLISFLDRTNIGNAKIQGLARDLNMKPDDYNLTLTVFFITYSVFGYPFN